MQDGYKFSNAEHYFAPPDGTYEECMEYISTLPLEESPEVFGLHTNANIAYET
jgi:dynein heavy chain